MKNKHIGSNFDDFLEEEGGLEEIEGVVLLGRSDFAYLIKKIYFRLIMAIDVARNIMPHALRGAYVGVSFGLTVAGSNAIYTLTNFGWEIFHLNLGAEIEIFFIESVSNFRRRELI